MKTQKMKKYQKFKKTNKQKIQKIEIFNLIIKFNRKLFKNKYYKTKVLIRIFKEIKKIFQIIII